MYSILVKAWENVDLAGSESYTWSDCEQRKRKRWLQSSILNLCQRRDYLGKKVRYASDMVLKHSQKGDSDFLRSAAIGTPLIS